MTGISDVIGSYPTNDAYGHCCGFAASGYGIMWNTRYLEGNWLQPAKEWDDLEKPEYFGHVGMSVPSRPRTTHLTVETVPQGEGWNKGRADGEWMGGKVASVTERSLSPEGQKALFDPAIMRLPVNPEVHAAPPEGLPNPFADTSIGAAIPWMSTSRARATMSSRRCSTW